MCVYDGGSIWSNWIEAQHQSSSFFFSFFTVVDPCPMDGGAFIMKWNSFIYLLFLLSLGKCLSVVWAGRHRLKDCANISASTVTWQKSWSWRIPLLAAPGNILFFCLCNTCPLFSFSSCGCRILIHVMTMDNENTRNGLPFPLVTSLTSCMCFTRDSSYSLGDSDSWRLPTLHPWTKFSPLPRTNLTERKLTLKLHSLDELIQRFVIE